MSTVAGHETAGENLERCAHMRAGVDEDPDVSVTTKHNQIERPIVEIEQKAVSAAVRHLIRAAYGNRRGHRSRGFLETRHPAYDLPFLVGHGLDGKS